MRGQRSPYAVLGLKPGADRAQLDLAYRALMKRHHPDLPDGDEAAAAEINRAYHLLKGQAPPAPRGLPLLERGAAPRRRAPQPGRVAGLVLLTAAATVMVAVPQPGVQVEPATAIASARPATGTADAAADVRAPDSFPDDLSVTSAVTAARKFARPSRPDLAVGFSRGCDTDVAVTRSAALLDHCIAFDTATVLLGGGGTEAQFSVQPMSERHLRAAMRVSDDPVLAEERVGRAKRAVQRALSPGND